MRCLAVGQAWQEAGGNVHFLSRGLSGELIKNLLAEKFSVTEISDGCEWEAIRKAVRKAPPSAILLDGYHFDAGYVSEARKVCGFSVVIDDLANLPWYDADLILNPTPGSEQLIYSKSPETQLLCGCRWALLRREFRQIKGRRRDIAETGTKVLVTLGGSDPDNVMSRVLTATQRSALWDTLEIIAVAGPASPLAASIEDTSRRFPRVDLRFNVSEMSSLMLWADVAITAGGSTSLEAAFLGLPALTIVIADNQKRNAEALDLLNVARNLGPAHRLSPEVISETLDEVLMSPFLRRSMSEAAAQLIDGNGATSLVSLILGLS